MPASATPLSEFTGCVNETVSPLASEMSDRLVLPDAPMLFQLLVESVSTTIISLPADPLPQLQDIKSMLTSPLVTVQSIVSGAGVANEAPSMRPEFSPWTASTPVSSPCSTILPLAPSRNAFACSVKVVLKRAVSVTAPTLPFQSITVAMTLASLDEVDASSVTPPVPSTEKSNINEPPVPLKSLLAPE